ncbi:MAG: J domain-containing protein [Alphaproteobacteria bacterium]
MYESEHKIGKVRLEVEVELDDGARLLGFLFIKQMQRLSDLLNDTREFLPFQSSDGLIVHLRKAAIARITQLDQAIETGAAIDPYEILGVSPRVSNDDLRKAYHEICARHHPDKLVSLGLAAEYIDLANSRIIRVIDAYGRIQKQRKNEAAGTKRRHQASAAS